MVKVAITCNGTEPRNLFPVFVLGSAAAACGYEVVLFFTPGGASSLVKGELEKIKAKGMPDILELYESLLVLDGKILVCELVLGAKDIKKEDFREEVKIVGAAGFLAEIKDAQITFSF
ncbi:unnamed protein product [marine sediment metagenome]|uniref:Uncharacterized protein n=1 Tax=marine sediment metagenome TaxID=412755 RepID=X1TUS1_9ZZZZ